MIELHGSTLQGHQITLQMDQTSKDNTKLIVYGLAPGIEWQEMKDPFSRIGVVAYANVTSRGPGTAACGKKGGGKKGCGKQDNGKRGFPRERGFPQERGFPRERGYDRLVLTERGFPHERG